MKKYTKVTQNAEGQLFGWYPVLDESGDMHQDYDLIDNYTAEQVGTTYKVTHTPTGNVIGTYSSKMQAMDGVRDAHNDWVKFNEKKAKMVEEFQNLLQKTSLEERYKNVEPKKVVLTNDQLKKKYSRVQKEAIRQKGMNRWSASIQKKQGGYDTFK